MISGTWVHTAHTDNYTTRRCTIRYLLPAFSPSEICRSNVVSKHLAILAQIVASLPTAPPFQDRVYRRKLIAEVKRHTGRTALLRPLSVSRCASGLTHDQNLIASSVFRAGANETSIISNNHAACPLGNNL